MRKRANFYLSVLVISVLMSSAEAAHYSGGSGTETDPYQIVDTADWTTFSTSTADWNKHFILIWDIDFGGVSLTPIGKEMQTFSGVFDGKGYTLRNAQIIRPESNNIGIFGYVDFGGIIKNLGVEAVTIAGKNWVGGLIGRLDEGSVASCYTTGVITGTDDVVGGLVGSNEKGSITLCYSTCEVIGDTGVGGLAGTQGYGGVITSSSATGTVTGNLWVGGLIGRNGDPIEYCYATGAVHGTENVGGLVGFNVDGTTTSCFAIGVVTGETKVGGLVGLNDYGSVNSCFSRGTVMCDDGSTYVGGLVGKNYRGSIVSCYSTGVVTGGEYVGGLIGSDYDGNITPCYWDMDASGLTTSASGHGRSTVQMTYPYAANTYMGWDFTEVWAEDTDYIMNNGYPYLRECMLHGEGEIEGEEEGEGEIIEGEPEEGEGDTFVPNPADLNSDHRIVMSEAIAYLSGWQQGNNPIGYAIRAAYLWQNAEHYIYDAEQTPPLCWMLAP